ncbi:uncharacterized protein LOC135608378 isoform X1 [Musa acuminata AAA Group]|uniref:uncharacterized protein LOC103975256 isoform X1 n=1 Tax=Musa acuminata AAA Group TaxID=214697 RepID=UPI0031DC348F
MVESNALLEEAARLAEAARELQEAAAILISRTRNEEQSLRQRAVALESDLRRLQSSLDSTVRKKGESATGGGVDPKIAEKVDEELCRARCVINDGDVASLLLSKTHGRFLKMFLGPVNVRATRKEVQLKVKEEYNSYRNSLFISSISVHSSSFEILGLGCMPSSIACPAISGLAVIPIHNFSFAGKHIESKWKRHSSLICRKQFCEADYEHILGSCVKNIVVLLSASLLYPFMWICHHYCAMLMALISLTWEIKRQPDCAYKQRGVQLFLMWAMMQGVSMLLQNRYQRQRLYTRIALGKAKRMDVVWGETAGVEGQLWLLCPILFILQGFEAYVGLLLLRTAFVGVICEWQVIVCGILLVLMAIGNFANTMQTLIAKSRFKAKMKRTRSK